jgi:hypothetical protein
MVGNFRRPPRVALDYARRRLEVRFRIRNVGEEARQLGAAVVPCLDGCGMRSLDLTGVAAPTGIRAQTLAAVREPTERASIVP